MIKKSLQNHGYSEPQIEKILKSKTLTALHQDTLLHNINRNYALLYELGYTKEEIIKLTTKSPAIYGYGARSIQNKINGLISLGYTKEEVIQITLKMPSLIGYKLESTKQKIEFIKEIGLESIIVENPMVIMQSTEVMYAHYQYLKECNLLKDKKSYHKIFYNNKEFKRQFKISKEELLEKYNYNEYKDRKVQKITV